jgi:hypothetical protein
MTAPLDNPRVMAALERAGMSSPSLDVIERLRFACNLRDGPNPDEILEISHADWANEDQGTDVLVIQTRDGVLLVGKGKRGRFKPVETFAIRGPYDYYQDLAEDDEMARASVVFLAKDGHKPFLLSFANAGERHRMFRCLFEAHAGYFSRWGLQLDPTSYITDFDRFYAEIRTTGPSESAALYEWVQAQYGEHDLSNALGCAWDWRSCELDDEARPDSARRVSRLAFPFPWADHPEARRVYVQVGEKLYDEGLLGRPYDERSLDTNEPLHSSERGPSRLIALMTLAAYAKMVSDPRANEWIAAAQAGIPTVPAVVLPPKLRELWADIDPLPAVDDGPPPEMPIWEDADVRGISMRSDAGAHQGYSVDMLTPSDKALVTGFLDSVVSLQEQDLPDELAVTTVCLAGVAAFEGLSPLAPTGWRKLLVYIVSDQTYELWEKHRLAGPAAKLAHWVVATIEKNGWGPDGRATPLGQHHSYAMGVAVGTGVGVIQFDPATGEAQAPTGSEARRAAAAGTF